MTASADIITDTKASVLSVPIQSVTVRTLEQLKADKELAQFSEFIFAQAPERNPVSGRISVQFRLRYQAATGGKK